MNKVFVAELPWTVGIQELRNYCSRFGKMRTCEVIFDYKTGFSKGYGFAVFQRKADMQKFLAQEHRIDNGKVVVREAAF